jgi:hypothetical protein
VSEGADIVTLGASSLDPETGAAKWQAEIPGGDNLGEADVFGALGVTALPYPADESGNAEALALRNCGGRTAVCVGARDTRTADVARGLKPGDVCLHSTGPKKSAQVRCLEEKRQVVAATKDSKDRAVMVLLDGKNEKIQIAGFGAMIQIDPSGDISISNGGGAAILIQGDTITFAGKLAIPGLSGFVMQCSSPASPGGAGALAMTAVKSISGIK